MDTVRIGIVGIGGRGNGFASMFGSRSGSQVVAVAEKNSLRAERAKANLGLDFDIHNSVHELVARDDIDAVVITTPDYLHKKCAVAALSAGKHILIDKPIATSIPDGLEVLEAARKNDRILFMGFNLRYFPVLAKAHELIAAGKIGTPFYTTGIEYYSGGKTYMARWNRLKRCSGGLFLHKGSHDFDILNWMNGSGKPVRVAAFSGVNALKPEGLPFKLEEGEKAGPNCQTCQVYYKCPDRRPKPEKSDKLPLFDMETAELDGYVRDMCIFMSDKDTYDNAVSIVEYDNGAKAFHSEVFVTPQSNRLYTVIGELGHMDIDLKAKSIDVFPRWTHNRETYSVTTVSGGHGGSDPTLVDSFINVVQRGERPRASGIDGVWSIAVGCAAEIAREEKRVVEISELLDPDNPLLNE